METTDKGKKRSRKSISSDAVNQYNIPNSKRPTARAKRMNVKPKTDGLFMSSHPDAKIKTTFDTTRTPKPKRRKVSSGDTQSDAQKVEVANVMVEDKVMNNATPSLSASRQEEIVHHISNFLSMTTKTTKSFDSMDVDATQQSKSKEEPLDSIMYLVQFLETQDAKQSVDDVTITEEDVVTLLLPWSVSRLVRLTLSTKEANKDGDGGLASLVWKALSSCLAVLASEATATLATATLATTPLPSSTASVSAAMAESLLSNAFSQGTLTKLIPFAARASFASGNDTNISSTQQQQMHASCCYVQFVHRYRPSLDVACNSLLSDVDDLVSTSSQNPTAPQMQVVTATLNLILSIMGNSNPKRTFGTLCSVEVLPRLGRLNMIQSSDADGSVMNAKRLVQGILWDGLLHPVHHMDGFRTMTELRNMPDLFQLRQDNTNAPLEDGKENDVVDNPKSGGKTCYQAGLFTTLKTLLSLETNAESEGRNVISTATLLPVITRGFFERIRDHGKLMSKRVQDGSGGTATTTEEDAKLQFRFWCHAVLPALERLFVKYGSKKDLDVSLLTMTSDTLEMVLEYDAYLPSYSDPEEEHLSYLELVAKGLLLCATNDRTESTGAILGRTEALVTSFRSLLLLNHRVLHERLSHVVAFACSSLHQFNHAHSKANSLVSSIVKTYRELRQIGHFLASTRETFSTANKTNHGTGSMHNLLSCRNIVESMTLAYQSCPSGQLHEIWEFFDDWIVTAAGNLDSSDSSLVGELPFAVQSFIVFMKGIRTNKQNSPELRVLCERSMTTSLSKLLSKYDDDASLLTRQGFDLCGWLVDLHTRSSFWVDNVDVDEHGSAFLLSSDNNAERPNVLEYLHNIAENTVVSRNFKDWKATWLASYWNKKTDGILSDNLGLASSLFARLQRLALHRVHQLHSMIYYSKVQEMEIDDDDIDNYPSNALMKEAKMLVDFSLYIACTQLTTETTAGASDESLWDALAQSLSIWTHYCDEFHAELFLIWFFSLLRREKSATVATSPIFHYEKAIVLTLARDASFYDIRELMALIMPVGIKFASTLLINNIDYGGKEMENLREAIFRETITSDTSSATYTCGMFSNGLALQQNIELDDEAIRGVAAILSFLASAPMDLPLCDVNINLVDKICGFDELASSISELVQGKSEILDASFLKALRSNRTILATILSRTLLTSSESSSFLSGMVILRWFPRLSSQTHVDLLRVTGDATNELFSLCYDYHDKEKRSLTDFMRGLEMKVLNGDDDTFLPRLVLIRAVLRRMNILDRHNNLNKKNATSNVVFESCAKFVNIVKNKWWRMLMDNISGGDVKVAAPSLLLVSEILSFYGNHLANTTETALMPRDLAEEVKAIVGDSFELVANLQSLKKRNRDVIEASSYFMSSMAAVPIFFFECIPSAKGIELVLNGMKSSFSDQRECLLLDAALCSLIRHSGLEDIQLVVSYILRTNDGKPHEAAFIVKVYHMLITCAKSQDQQTFLSSQGKTFLLISMGLLRGKQYDTTQLVSNVALFSKMMTTLISKKELLLFSGREIAMICSEMNPLFRAYDRRETTADDDVLIFKSCCSLVSSLVSHYPKQLYGCPSPLFSLLLALLTNIFQTNAKKGLSQMALEYAK